MSHFSEIIYHLEKVCFNSMSSWDHGTMLRGRGGVYAKGGMVGGGARVQNLGHLIHNVRDYVLD